MTDLKKDPWAGMPEPVHDWEGGVFQKSYYDKGKIDALHTDLKDHYKLIEKQAETLRLLFGDEGVKTENLMKIQTWRIESDYWRELQEHPHFSGSDVERIIGQSELDVQSRERKVALLEKVAEWAFWMGSMYEDCTYLSHEAFDKDAKRHLEDLVALVGGWLPPEIRDQVVRPPRLTLIDYRDQKALVLTSEDLMKLGRSERMVKENAFEAHLKETLKSARAKGIIALLIVTSFPLSQAPKWLRTYVDHRINCHRGFFEEIQEGVKA